MKSEYLNYDILLLLTCFVWLNETVFDALCLWMCAVQIDGGASAYMHVMERASRLRVIQQTAALQSAEQGGGGRLSHSQTMTSSIAQRQKTLSSIRTFTPCLLVSRVLKHTQRETSGCLCNSCARADSCLVFSAGTTQVVNGLHCHECISSV